MKTALKIVGALVVLGMIGSACGESSEDTTPVKTTSTEIARSTVTTTDKTTVTSTKIVGSTVTKTETAAAEPADDVALSDIDSAPAGALGNNPVVQQQGFAAIPQQQQQSNSSYYKNCTAARNAGVTPLYAGDPGYGSHLDRDGDGVACE